MSVLAFSSSMMRHGARSVRSGGLPFFFATLMTALGAFSLGAWLTLLANFQRLSAGVGESVAAVAFLRVESAAEAEEVRARLALDPRVLTAKLVSPDEALRRARRGLGDAGKALEGSVGLRMPWIIEVTPKFDPALARLPRPSATQRGAQAGDVREVLLASLQAMPEVDEVMNPGGEIRRVDALLRLIHGAAAFLGLLLGLVVTLVVSNAVKLTVLQRRDEIEIMRLVGATNLFVRMPFVLSGLVQGIAGTLLGLGALAAMRTSLVEMVKLALSGSLGTFDLQPLPGSWSILLVVGGASLGALGAFLAVRGLVRA